MIDDLLLIQVARQLRIGVPVEKDASLVYTRAMYERFSRELFKSGLFACGESGDNGIFRVILLNGRSDNGQTEYRVGASPDFSSYYRECKMFEHSGIPCRHILRVSIVSVLIHFCRPASHGGLKMFFCRTLQLLVQTGVDRLPQSLVMKRWTVEAKVGTAATAMQQEELGSMSSDMMRTVLHTAAMELVNLCAASRQAFELGLDYVSRAKKAVCEMTIIAPVGGDDDGGNESYARPAVDVDASVIGDISESVAPGRVRSRGRPKVDASG